MIAESLTLNEQYQAVPPSLSANHRLMTERLKHESQSEVLRFLAERPLHTAVMSGFIRDNGLESKLNRGCFYGYRNKAAALEGVSLIGHATFIEARCDDAMLEFSRLARDFPNAHMIMGEHEMIQRFWKYYSSGGQASRSLCQQTLFELRQPRTDFYPVSRLRTASLDDLSTVMSVHAALAFAESGVDPLQIDPAGFRLRCQRRIEQGRVWVWVENGNLIFKADVISDTPDVSYLEGIYVDPNQRGKGFGSRCVLQLSHHLLRRSKSISVLVNQECRHSQTFFHKLGFLSRGLYDTIFLQTKKELL